MKKFVARASRPRDCANAVMFFTTSAVRNGQRGLEALATRGRDARDTRMRRLWRRRLGCGVLLFVICFVFRVSDFGFSAYAAEPTTAPSADVRAVVRENMAPVGGSTSVESQRLQEAIDRLNATKLEPRRGWPVTNPLSPRPSREADDPMESSDPATAARPAGSRGADALTVEQLAALRTLKGLPAGESGLLGAALQKAGHLDEAFLFFEQAMRVSSGAEQAYFLLQMAHCRRAGDPAGAQTLYRRVAAEFADTPWAVLAGAYDSALEFARVHRPQEVIRNAASDPADVITLPPAKPAAGAVTRQTTGGRR